MRSRRDRLVAARKLRRLKRLEESAADDAFGEIRSMLDGGIDLGDADDLEEVVKALSVIKKARKSDMYEAALNYFKKAAKDMDEFVDERIGFLDIQYDLMEIGGIEAMAAISLNGGLVQFNDFNVDFVDDGYVKLIRIDEYESSTVRLGTITIATDADEAARASVLSYTDDVDTLARVIGETRMVNLILDVFETNNAQPVMRYMEETFGDPGYTFGDDGTEYDVKALNDSAADALGMKEGVGYIK